jgi:hypothetical protein
MAHDRAALLRELAALIGGDETRKEAAQRLISMYAVAAWFDGHHDHRRQQLIAIERTCRALEIARQDEQRA